MDDLELAQQIVKSIHDAETNERADLVAQQLATIMKTLLVKRLDSSFVAFVKSLRRFRDATNAMVRMFESGTVYIAPNLNVSEYILEDREDELLDEIRETLTFNVSIPAGNCPMRSVPSRSMATRTRHALEDLDRIVVVEMDAGRK